MVGEVVPSSPRAAPNRYDEPLRLYRGPRGLDVTSDGSPCRRPFARAALPSGLHALPGTDPESHVFLKSRLRGPLSGETARSHRRSQVGPSRALLVLGFLSCRRPRFVLRVY